MHCIKTWFRLFELSQSVMYSSLLTIVERMTMLLTNINPIGTHEVQSVLVILKSI